MRQLGAQSAALLFVFGMLFQLHANPAGAAALGTTPNHLVGLWTNVNDCLVTAAPYAKDDAALRTDLAAMTPNRYDGVEPRDVFDQVVAFRSKLDRLRSGSKLNATKTYRTDDTAISASHVFVNSGHALNGLVEWLIVSSEKDQLVSRFYKDHELSGKTLDDAFALAELANRRLDSILSATGL